MTIIAVTGASGAVGRALIPDLVRNGFDPLLFGRDSLKLRALFPDCEVFDNNELVNKLASCEAVLHLAAINNNQSMSEADVHSVNVAWPIFIAKHARSAGVRRFVYLSSTHAIQQENRSLYALSKREMSDALSQVAEIDMSEIVAPKIYDDDGSPISNLIWKSLGAIKPTLPSSQLKRVVVEELRNRNKGFNTRLTSKENSRPWLYSVFNAVVDIGFALSVFILFGWLLALIAVAIKVDSPGPALFRQVRVGRSKRLFTCWKFRTMRVGTAHRATHEMHVSSITRVGAFLRRTKLDELPQLVNLMRRELSLVGPRPCLPSQTELIDLRDQRGVYDVRPGITGYAQINHVDMSHPKILALWDERYCALRSIIFDLQILLATFTGGGRGDRVRG